MGRSANPDGQRRRRQLAMEAARLMLAGGHRDYSLARRKAARRLALTDPGLQPDDREIDAALRELQRLVPSLPPERLRALREAALQAMQALAAFAPRLVGPVLDGSADAHSPVRLHLHSDDAEAVPRLLEELGLPARLRFRRLRLDRERAVEAPLWVLHVDGLEFELAVLPGSALRHAPLQGAASAPMPRASAAALRRLLGAPADGET